jgi:hypothetical protein
MPHPLHAPCAFLLALLPALTGCSSTRAAAPPAVGVPVRIRALSYTSDQAFELVNETHTDRVELYSSVRSSAETKVQTDEVVDEVLAYFEKLGFFEDAQPGLAPPSAPAGVVRAIEVDSPGRQVYMGIGAQSPKEEQAVFNQCFAAFLQVYNETYQLQAVDQDPGWTKKSQRPPH